MRRIPLSSVEVARIAVRSGRSVSTVQRVYRLTDGSDLSQVGLRSYLLVAEAALAEGLPPPPELRARITARASR